MTMNVNGQQEMQWPGQGQDCHRICNWGSQAIERQRGYSDEVQVRSGQVKVEPYQARTLTFGPLVGWSAFGADPTFVKASSTSSRTLRCGRCRGVIPNCRIAGPLALRLSDTWRPAHWRRIGCVRP